MTRCEEGSRMPGNRGRSTDYSFNEEKQHRNQMVVKNIVVKWGFVQMGKECKKMINYESSISRRQRN